MSRTAITDPVPTFGPEGGIVFIPITNDLNGPVDMNRGIAALAILASSSSATVDDLEFFTIEPKSNWSEFPRADLLQIRTLLLTKSSDSFWGLTSAETLIARGIARMIYYTALEQKIALSRASRAMLQIVADTAWRPSDLSSLHSTYPDITAVSGDDKESAKRRLSELLSSWEKLEI
ncbi:hypothetical protein CERZMDRAFT_97696 [Cercospora zeae-maydis SCOH1-5]|uniref:Uncharacterized protein n=1 Tax=Cercospora zeae-maydis SCOH1-5 TaxID=717836 RepID=A0A6A6FGI2_9PEZI|nr:hypothetical protein CERZMDRAFT_97696 [Cercospora zeae-maydis SCOH1-5]